MKFIQLTYYKTGKNYGTAGGATTKKFYLSIDSVVRITEYDNSVKLSLITGEDVEVCEPLDLIKKKVTEARSKPQI